MAYIEPSAQLTPREHEQMAYEERIWDKQAEFNLEVKRLELEVAKIEARWNSWFKLPALIIKLPVLILLGIGYIVMCVTKQKPEDNFWHFINK